MGFYELKSLLIKHQTLNYDKASPVHLKARGIPVPVKSSCSNCKSCEKLCPTQAIKMKSEKEIFIDYGACLQCGLCVEACTEDALENSGFNYVFSTNREELKITYKEGNFTPSDFTPSENTSRFREFTHKRGFNYREVAASGNNAVECELNASFNSVFDSEGQMVKSVASPKHADAVVYSGPVGVNMEGPLLTAWKCMPEPKALIAAGTEAIMGGVFCQGNLPSSPDLFIAGDPPRPDVMLNAFRYLMGQFPFSFQKALHKFLSSSS
jgi:Ni,Fe-hydrogenase III small subunit/ferredoxin